MKKSFRKWFKELVKFARSFNDGGDVYVKQTKNDWKGYYEGGYTPKDAHMEDLSYA